MLSMFLILKIDLDALIGILNDPLPVNAETSLEETLFAKTSPSSSTDSSTIAPLESHTFSTSIFLKPSSYYAQALSSQPLL